MSPAVSIVIDNFDYGRYLAAAIDSALDQTLPGVEVIVVDDGSTDDSRSIIEAYASRVTAVLKPNGGQASALNAGWRVSHGGVVLFLDADDTLDPRTAERVHELFTAQPSLAKVQYRMVVIDEHGTATGEVKPPPFLPMPHGVVADAELRAPFDLTWLPTSGNAFPAWVLRSIMPIPEDEFRACADWYLQHLPPLFGPVASQEWIGASYRVHCRNSYESSSLELDLDHVRQSISYAAATRPRIIAAARRAGLEPPVEILSVADLANRITSRRLQPAQHPLANDRVPGLVLRGWRACVRRKGASVVLRLAFAVWFLAVALLPRPAATRLATALLVPASRPRANRALARLRRRR